MGSGGFRRAVIILQRVVRLKLEVRHGACESFNPLMGPFDTHFQEVILVKAPGHTQWPDHKVGEQNVGAEMKVEVRGAVVADSREVIRVDEDGSPVRFYFPRNDVVMSKLEPSSTTTHCPFKGTANYFNLKLDGRTFKDAVWSYENPYEEHRALEGRLAFYDDHYREIHVQTAT